LPAASSPAQPSPSADHGRAPSGSRQQYLKTVWTTEEGLPQNTITALVESRDGYLWLGTFGGLVRFDGARFTIFNSSNTPPLKSNRITALLEDREGSLWIGAESGEIARYRQGAFAAWPGVGGTILSFYQDRRGLIWGLRMSARPIRFAPAQPEQAAVVSAAQGLESERMYSICEDRAGQLWATTRQGLALWRDGAFRTAHGIEGLPQRGLPRVAPHPDGSLWVVEEKGLGRIVNGRFGLLVETADVMGIPPPPLFETRRGEIWFGYREDQLWRGTRDGGFSELTWREAAPHFIRALLEDREGNLWLGTRGGGLIRLRPHRVTTLAKADGLPSDEILAISEDAQGHAWVATQPGMSRLAGGQITSTMTSWNEAELKRQLGLPHPHTFYRDQTGNFWLGGNRRLAQIRDGQWAVEELQGVSGLDGSVFVRAMLTDRSGARWLGFSGQGLARYSGGTLTRLYTPADGLVHGNLTVLREDRTGALWIGTQQGLSRFQDGRFTNLTTQHGLSNDHVRDLCLDPDGALWIGTYGGGLNRLKDGRLTPITTRQGLFDDVVSRILADDRDRFWMLGNRGIFYVSRHELNDVADGRRRAVTCGSYGVADGMLSSEGNGLSQPAGWRMRDGRLWFPTLKGVAIVDPRDTATTPPPVVIEAATLESAAVDVGRTIDLAPGQQNLELRFTALHFGKPEQVRFKYRLEGLDREWIDVGTRRAANFTYLPPGAYTFHVTAANPDGVWNEEGAHLRIIVRPHFYQTWWFWSLAVAGILGTAFLGFKIRVNQVERARALQETFSRRLIDSQEQERQRIAAELHDSLGQNLLVIKNRAAIAKLTSQDLPAAFQQLDQIADSTLQALQEVRQIAYNLRPHHLDSIGLTRSLEEMLRRVEETSGLGIARELAPLEGALPKEAEINFYRVVQEAVSNIVKHARATQAGVEIERQGDRLRLTIRDNGCGFEVEAPAERRGFGLAGWLSACASSAASTASSRRRAKARRWW